MSFPLHDISFFAVLSPLVAALYAYLHGLRVLRDLAASKLRSRLPPGPVGLPILGQCPSVSCCKAAVLNVVLDAGCFPFLMRYPELTLDRWAKKFGPLYSMWLGDQLFVVVSDPKVVKDLVVTNGAVFSSRKEMYMKSQQIFVRRGITATPYDDHW